MWEHWRGRMFFEMVVWSESQPRGSTADTCLANVRASGLRSSLCWLGVFLQGEGRVQPGHKHAAQLLRWYGGDSLLHYRPFVPRLQSDELASATIWLSGICSVARDSFTRPINHLQALIAG